MNIEKELERIKEEIKKVISSPGNHACRDNPENICSVASPVLNDIVFVTNKNYPRCPYYKNFGYGGFCNLPVRKEIYDRYGV